MDELDDLYQQIYDTTIVKNCYIYSQTLSTNSDTTIFEYKEPDFISFVLKIDLL